MVIASFPAQYKAQIAVSLLEDNGFLVLHPQPNHVPGAGSDQWYFVVVRPDQADQAKSCLVDNGYAENVVR